MVNGRTLRIGVFAGSLACNAVTGTVIWRNGHPVAAAVSAAACLLTLAYWKRLRAYLRS